MQGAALRRRARLRDLGVDTSGADSGVCVLRSLLAGSLIANARNR